MLGLGRVRLTYLTCSLAFLQNPSGSPPPILAKTITSAVLMPEMIYVQVKSQSKVRLG